MREPLPALCKSHRCNIKSCFHFLLQSCGIIRGYTIWRSLQITHPHPRLQTRHPVLPTHAFSVTVFTLRASSLKQWLQELCSFEWAVYQQHITVQFSVRQLQAGVKGSPFRRQQFWKKKRYQLEKLLGSGRHKFSSFLLFFFPEILYKGRLRSFGCCSGGHFFCLLRSVFHALTTDFLCIAISSSL